MAEPPDIDGRRREELREHVAAIAPHYVENWDATDGDAGSALVDLFTELSEDVIERLDDAPEKHRVAFFDALGFDQRPPQAASVPVQYAVAPGAPENRRIEEGTEVIAEATDARPAQTFRVGAEEAFEATPARLQSLLSVDPASDELFDHAGAIDGGEAATLFAGENQQENHLYVGHGGVLTAGKGTRIEVVLDTTAAVAVLEERVTWEYYGEKPTDAGEVQEGWHAVAGVGADEGGGLEALRPEIVPAFDPDQLVPLQARTTTATKRLFRSIASGSTTGSGGAGRQRGGTTPQQDGAGSAGTTGSASVQQLLNPNVSVGPILPGTFGGQLPQLPTFPEFDRSDVGASTGQSNTVTVTLEPDGPLVETAVNGTKSKWIRCRIPSARTPTGPLDVELDRVGLAPAPTDLGPDMLLANDIPQKPGEDAITPFGDQPAHRDTFYVGCAEAFRKAGAEVTITFHPQSLAVAIPPPISFPTLPTVEPKSGDGLETPTLTPVYQGDPVTFEAVDLEPSEKKSTDGGTTTANDPQVSWEYWNGDGWAKLSVEDATENFRNDQRADFDDDESATVTFTAPDDVAPTSVAGHDGVWIRARLVGGDYGDRVYVNKSTNNDGNDEWVPQFRSTPPVYGDISITYDYPEGTEPEHLFAKNARAFGPDLLDREGPFRPFQELTDEQQAVYLGFDAPLQGGPIQLFVDLDEHEYPEEFASRLKWEYCIDPETDTWAPLSVTDETEGLTEWGIVGLSFPEETVPFQRFGEQRHWIRARVREDAFGLPRFDTRNPAEFATSVLQAGEGVRDAGSAGGRDACGEVVETEPPAGAPTNARPTLLGLYHNTGRAANVTAVSEEAIGSSDGSPDQTHAVARPPVIDGDIWVDELSALSATQREELEAERPDDVEARRTESGELTAFWVRWEVVGDFLDSGSGSRHCVLDRTAGEVSFGDGVSGMIPPRGRDNVRASYRTGGGDAGNVTVGAITGAKSSLPYVDAVSNPAPGAGGAAAESTAAVLDRAPRTLRDRGRAVTPADFERIASDASRRLARVRCIEGMNRMGDSEPGWVTLLIVPDDQRPKPVPSVGLKRDVEDAVAARAPAALVAQDRLVVRGPSYVGASVDATLVAGDVRSISALEERVDEELVAFFHPLTGGPESEGWAFGELPTLSALFALIEGIEGVDHVSSLSITFDGGKNVVTVTEGEATPSVAADAFVYGDGHDLTVRMTDLATDGGS
ncbi:MAG: putative baseplate assembly protein [Haloarcula sp.]